MKEESSYLEWYGNLLIPRIESGMTLKNFKSMIHSSGLVFGPKLSKLVLRKRWSESSLQLEISQKNFKRKKLKISLNKKLKISQMKKPKISQKKKLMIN